MLTVAVDIDGVLTLETAGWDYENRSPSWSHISLVNRIWEKGHLVVLYTSRRLEDLKITEKWLSTHGVKFDHIIFDKPKYDILIDDKAMKPELVDINGDQWIKVVEK